jgi:hypothetical protein
LLLIGQQHGLGHFFRYRPLLSIGCANFTPMSEEITKTAPTTLSAKQQQTNLFLSIHDYTPLVISGNDIK